MVGRTSAWVAGATLWALLVVCQPSARAQSDAASAPTDEELADARRIFATGIRHADRGEWEDAVVCFRQVMEVRQAPPVLYNLGAALVALGQYPEAEPLLRRVVDDPNAEASLVERARESLTTMAQRGGRMTIELVDGSPASIVTIDGVVLAHDQLGVELPLSAGRHEIVVREGADELLRRIVQTAPGEHGEVLLSLGGNGQALQSADDAQAAGADDRASSTRIGTSDDPAERRRRRLHNPWLWTGVGVGAAIVGATIFAIVYDPPVDPPARGNTNPAVIRF